MELRLKINKDIQVIQQKNKIVWRLTAKPYYRLILFALLLGICLISFGIMSPFTFKVMTKENGIKIYSLHIAVTLGLAFLIIAVYNFIYIRSARKKVFQ